MRETVEYEGQVYDKIPVSRENDCTGCCFYKGKVPSHRNWEYFPRCYDGKHHYIFKEVEIV